MDRNPFIVDGPVPADSPMYLERVADKELFSITQDHGNRAIINLVAPPGLGKTSLITRTVAKERQIDSQSQFVVINLSDLDDALTDDGWYERFVQLISVPWQLDDKDRERLRLGKREDWAVTLLG
jgi:hypothetical protein